MDAVDPTYTAPFIALGPVASKGGTGDYTNLAAWTGNALESPPCQKVGLVNTRFPIDLDTYNIQAQRKIYDLFASTLEEIPALNGSLILFEGYSLQGVQAVPEESTAVPFRENHLLVAPLLLYKAENKKLDEQSRKLGEKLRDILFRASGKKERDTYVNYAFGEEGVKNWYGNDAWRLQRLRALKRKYDPKGRFSFYAPIA